MGSPLLSNTLPVAEVSTSGEITSVRLAGASNTDYRDMTLFDIAAFVPPQVRRVRITGAEPLHGDKLWMLLSTLAFDDKTIYLETDGTLDPPNYMKGNGRIRWSFKG